MEVQARLVQDGVVVRAGILSYAGERNTFAGTLEPVPPGSYELQVIGSEPRAVNFGMARRQVTLTGPMSGR